MAVDPLARIDAHHHLHPFCDPEAIEETGPLVIAKGDGVYLEDTSGRRYLDGLAGLWCVQVGYGRQELVEAARRQLERLPFYNTFFGTTTEPLAQLVDTLRGWTPDGLDTFLFANSGSEAIDTAIRMVRHYWQLEGRPERRIIIGRELGYHGSTLAAASVGGMVRMHAQGGLPLDGFAHVMPPYAFEYAREGEPPEHFGLRAAEALDAKIRALGPDNVAAFFAEPVQGAGGVIIPPDSYWPAVQEICRRHDVLLVADEVICGFGRTGQRFGCNTFDIAPDLMTMAKGLTSGYMPMSALALAPRIADKLRRAGSLQHGFTYSGHPVAAAVALANLELIEKENLIERTRTHTGPRLREALRPLADLPTVGEIRTIGLLAAIDLVEDKETRARFEPAGTSGKRASDLCREAGLIVRPLREGIALCPALTIENEELEDLASRLKQALARL